MRIGYGTIQGAAHRNLDYNNQDAAFVFESGNVLIGVIADGCGSGTNSEVGAQLAVKRITKIIFEKIESKIDWKNNLKPEMQFYAKTLAELHGSNIAEFVKDYLLFTLVGFVKIEAQLTLFSCGDGVIVIDDDILIIDQDNRPKYLNNELMNAEGADFEFQDFEYSGQNILIGSDGVEDIIKGIDKKEITEYYEFNDFISDEANYINPIQISKFLQKYSKSGILKDDCTLIMIKE